MSGGKQIRYHRRWDATVGADTVPGVAQSFWVFFKFCNSSILKSNADPRIRLCVACRIAPVKNVYNRSPRKLHRCALCRSRGRHEQHYPVPGRSSPALVHRRALFLEELRTERALEGRREPYRRLAITARLMPGGQSAVCGWKEASLSARSSGGPDGRERK
ncbi:hypothetical protein P4O66_007751 [Electrophorus voltai]|uniref:Uncharacterized protein n=1 Tax=Electrophorus voltai TaxID=2609070 RepID=A0AAD8ZF07_9TELE|nr:hypothetical protein P4O66_007751 [Electrophorus voltai]